MKFVYVVAALFAAVIEHRITEALSRSGLFSGAYATYEHIAVWPALVAAIVMLGALAICAFREHASRSNVEDWLVALARGATETPLRRSFATLLGTQLATLFAMESIEQIVSVGHVSSATAWLGAPVPAALAIAALIAFAIASLVRYGCSGLLAAARALGRMCDYLVVSTRPHDATFVIAPDARRRHSVRASLLAWRSGLRAPPLTL